MKKQTIKSAIELVTNSFPSIYSQENVLELLASIEGAELTDKEREELKEELRDELKEEMKEELKDEIEEEIKEDIQKECKEEFESAIEEVDAEDYIDKDEVELSLDGREISVDSLNFDSSGYSTAIINKLSF